MRKMTGHFVIMVLLAMAGVFLIPYAAQAADFEITTVIDLFGLAGVGGCSASNYETPCSDDPANGIFSSIACRVMKTFNAGIIPLYCNMIANPMYMQLIGAILTLYIVILGASYVMGLIPMRLGHFAGRLLKLSIVFTIITNADLYLSMVYSTALSLPQDLVKVLLDTAAGGVPGGGSKDFFQYIDKGVYELFNSVLYPEITDGSGQTYRKADLKILLAGIALWQLGGDLVGGLFFTVIVGWLVAYFSIMIRYLLAMLSMMFLLMLGPIFLPTLLFEKSKYLGEDWIRMIINFIIQIVLVVAFVVMTQSFYVDFYDTIKETMNATVMKESTEKYTVPFGSESYNVVDRVKYTPQTANDFMGSLFGSGTSGAGMPAADKLPNITLKLIITFSIVLLTFMFMQNVPLLALLIGGNPKFSQLFGGLELTELKGGTGKVPLLGQEGIGVKATRKPNLGSIVTAR